MTRTKTKTANEAKMGKTQGRPAAGRPPRIAAGIRAGAMARENPDA